MKAAKRPGSLVVVWLLAPLGLVLSAAPLSIGAASAVASIGAVSAAMPMSAASAATAAAFLSNLDDIPLMPGLVERRDMAISFDKPEGRIVEAVAEGRLSPGEVTKFYAATLPQLGWKGQGNNRFAREGEELALNISVAGHMLTVRFALSPKP